MARRSSPLPAFVEPQLAKLVKSAPEGDDWLHELKFDGYRILARLDRGDVELLSRRRQDWTESLPTVRDAVATLPARAALFDGEVAVVMPDGRTSFQALQNGFGARPPEGLTYFLFDLLHLDGEDLARLPLEERKARLRTLIDAAPMSGLLRFSDHIEGRGAEVFRNACTGQLEGIISKARGQPYQSGRRGGWLKTKCVQRQELVVGGFTEPDGARAGLGALLVGHYQDGKLTYAGKVGTGFTQKGGAELRARLDRLEQPASPFAVAPPRGSIGRNAHWVRPELVAEVEFAEWTADGRLRHPSFKGLRVDKPAAAVTRDEAADAPTEPRSGPGSTVPPASRRRAGSRRTARG